MFEPWDHPFRPCCSICGGLITVNARASTFYDKFHGWAEGDEFKRVRTDDFREVLLQEKFAWQSGYRAVVKLGTQAPFISGATYRHSRADMNPTGTIPVPKDVSSVVLTRKQTWLSPEFIRIKKPCMESFDDSEENVGWLFHEVCWVMLEQVDDDYHVMNDDLELFMIAVDDEMIEKREGFEKLITRAGSNALWLQQRFFEATHNPFHIPVLVDVIRAALNRPIPEPEPITHGVMTEAGFIICGGAFYKLHSETQQMIADYIDNEKDFRSFVLATQWKFPWEFWKKRIPECFYEIHKGIENQPVDWQWLGLEVSRIVDQHHPEIHNRARIYSHIKRLFGYVVARGEAENESAGTDSASEADTN